MNDKKKHFTHHVKEGKITIHLDFDEDLLEIDKPEKELKSDVNVMLFMVIIMFTFVIFGVYRMEHHPVMVQFCDADTCADSRAELEAFHEKSPWTEYVPGNVKIIQE